MTAEPVPIVPMDDGNFASDETTTVVLGECRCPGRPHVEDTAEVRRELLWETFVDVEAATSGPAAIRRLVLGALVSWTCSDADGDVLPITEDIIRRMRQERLEPIVEAAGEVLTRMQAALPNASGAPSRRSRRESASQNPTIRPRGRHTK